MMQIVVLSLKADFKLTFSLKKKPDQTFLSSRCGKTKMKNIHYYIYMQTSRTLLTEGDIPTGL